MATSQSLLERINQLIVSDRLALPVFNQAVLRLQQISAQEDFDSDEVERLIISDQTLAAEVLRAANSPFYGGLSPIRTIRNAVVRLGIKQVTRLVCLASEQSKYQAHDPQLSGMLQTLWNHASITAFAGQWLAKRFRFNDIEEECFLGGLLHDIGQLLIIRAIDKIKKDSGPGFVLEPQVVQEVLDTAHTQLGYTLLRRWNIPEVYCRIAQLHHAADFDATDLCLIIVRLANEAAKKAGICLKPDPGLVLSATSEANILRTSDVLLAELEITIEDHLGQPA